MTKAMGYVCLFAVMLGLGISQANASSCAVTISTLNISDENLLLLKLVRVRKDTSGARWKTAWSSPGSYVGADVTVTGTTLNFNKNCSYGYEVKVTYSCPNISGDKITGYGNVTMDNSDSIDHTVYIAC